MPLRRRGIALVVVLISIGLLGVIAWGMAAMGTHTLDISRNAVQNDQALLAADGGAWRAVAELARNGGFTGWGTAQTLPTTGASYTVSITNAGDTAPDGQVVPADMVYVLSVGTHRGETRQVGLMLRAGSSQFSAAIFAGEKVELDDGSRVDSWDSTAGNYPAGAQPIKAHIGTNGQTNSSIAIIDGSYVDGNLLVPPGASPGATEIDSSTVTGSVVTMAQAQTLDDVVLPAAPTGTDLEFESNGTLPPGAYGELEIDDGAILTLTAGTYVFRSIRMRGGGTIAIPGNSTSSVEIYVAGGVEIEDGSVMNTSRKPSLLKFFVRDGPVELDDDAGSAYFVCYAPKADVKFDDSSHMYGSLVGKTVEIKEDSGVTYDLSLGSATGGPTTVEVVSRQER